jgi:hypothetical protein
MEKQIEEYKIFYQRYLIDVRNRQQVISELFGLCQKFTETPSPVSFIITKGIIKLRIEAKELLSKYFPSEVISLYEKQLPVNTLKRKYNQQVENSFWLSLLTSLAETFEEQKEKEKQDLNYKKNFLLFLYDCFIKYGLHPNILKRDPSVNKRFNLILKHYYRSRKELTEVKINLTYDVFYTQFLKLYLLRKPIKVMGKLIPFDKISEVKVTTSLLKDDEIFLFAAKNNFKWTENMKEELKYAACCLDETELYHPNPFDESTHSKELNHLLIEQTKNFLISYPQALKPYLEALDKFGKKIYERNTLDDLRLSLEMFLKNRFQNNKSLENQLEQIGKWQKQNGVSQEITNTFHKVIDYYTKYHNSYVKHQDNVKSNEIEFMFNLTSTMIRFFS